MYGLSNGSQGASTAYPETAYSSGQGLAQAKAPETLIAAQTLGTSLDVLDQTTSELVQRLQAVLKRNDSEKNGVPGPCQQMASPFGQALQEASSKVDLINFRLRSVLNRLAI